ncbi:PGPGW domain-containing protein [Thermoflavimicrobium dichotomicum]|uniref:Putative transmembrane protein (PGPGW) n=1 Tax=Thermoflavimicrobium dichotomicum TaxID=46223 RepID=A0A1I3NEW3_9BACL|nr:PGPGW domain-containing protein [Thermoflavimicrobium dichotomicum]SFJ07657.1 Putative transmembrane protein (PGPGW) [Thermoflavimicrobium dichotomicum]
MKQSTWKRLGMAILGWGFIILGVIGGFIPILQGWIFILIGLYFLSFSSPTAKRLLEKLRARFPKVAEKADEFVNRWKKKPNSSE